MRQPRTGVVVAMVALILAACGGGRAEQTAGECLPYASSEYGAGSSKY